MKPVAVFHSPFESKFGVPRQSGLAEVPGEIRLEGEFRRPEILRGLDSFSYLWLIWGFSANARSASDWQPTVRPPRLGGNRSLGVFATRSPFRPNPLGLSSVRIVEVDEKNFLIRVSGADLMDGTPIYDIKPYLEYADSHPGAGNGFVDESDWRGLDVCLSDEIRDSLQEFMSGEQIAGLLDSLAQDPRPHYHNDPERVYGFGYCGADIRFRVCGNSLTVVEIVKQPK